MFCNISWIFVGLPGCNHVFLNAVWGGVVAQKMRRPYQDQTMFNHFHIQSHCEMITDFRVMEGCLKGSG